MTYKIQSKIHEDIKKIQEHSAKSLVAGMFFLAIVGVPISISRALYTGWQTAYTIHLLGLCILTVIYSLRNKLSLQVNIWAILGVALAVTVAGLLNYGVIGNGMLWIMFCLILCLFFIDNSTAIIVAVILLCSFLFSLYKFVFDGRKFPGDADVYISSLSAWGTAFFGSAIFILLIGIVLRDQQLKINELLVDLDHKNLTIEKQKQQIEHQANHDMLTGLPTLRLAQDRLEMAIKSAKRADQKTALLFLDLDGFKTINDTYGHDAGDFVLTKTAKRILSSIRECDTACRIGGDEFIVIFSKMEKTDDVAIFCSRLIKIIGSPIMFMDAEFSVGVSIGVAIYPTTAKDAMSLRKKADEVMYKVKISGKNNFLIAEP